MITTNRIVLDNHSFLAHEVNEIIRISLMLSVVKYTIHIHAFAHVCNRNKTNAPTPGATHRVGIIMCKCV